MEHVEANEDCIIVRDSGNRTFDEAQIKRDSV